MNQRAFAIGLLVVLASAQVYFSAWQDFAVLVGSCSFGYLLGRFE